MTKPIEGSWFDFQHANKPEAKYYNAACAAFTAEDWKTKVKEAAEIGMDYLVLMCVAMDFKAFYKTGILPQHDIACDDPIEAVLSAADRYGVKFFVGNDWFDNQSDWSRDILDPKTCTMRLQSMEEIAERYGHHPSFYGWYWSEEAYLKEYFSDKCLKYVNMHSAKARELMPKAKTMVAPYGTGVVRPDDGYLRQLETIDVDSSAYQDELGCLRHTVDDLPRIWEGLRKVHDRAQRVEMWADVEIFAFDEGEVGRSALLPAPFERVRGQLECAGDFVDRILIYQFQGLMNPAASPVFAGPASSVRLYDEYVAWVKERHPERLRTF